MLNPDPAHLMKQYFNFHKSSMIFPICLSFHFMPFFIFVMLNFINSGLKTVIQLSKIGLTVLDGILKLYSFCTSR